MKTFILSLLLILSIISCTKRGDVFTGYVVGKKQIPAHMSDENPKVINYCSFGVIFIPPAKQAPTVVEEQWLIYVANSDGVQEFLVLKKDFHNYQCGKRVSMIYN